LSKWHLNIKKLLIALVESREQRLISEVGYGSLLLEFNS